MQPNILNQYIRGSKLVLPVAGPLSSRGVQIECFYWVALSDYELVQYASQNELLFPLVFGNEQRAGSNPLSDYINHSGNIEIQLPGIGNILSKIKRMREAWAEAWNMRYQIKLAKEDHLVYRNLNGRLLKYILGVSKNNIPKKQLDKGGYPILENTDLIVEPNANESFMKEIATNINHNQLRRFARILSRTEIRDALFSSFVCQSKQIKNGTAVTQLRRYINERGLFVHFGASPTPGSSEYNAHPACHMLPREIADAYLRWENIIKPKLLTEHQPYSRQRSGVGLVQMECGRLKCDESWIESESISIVNQVDNKVKEKNKYVTTVQNSITRLIRSQLFRDTSGRLIVAVVKDSVFGKRLGIQNQSRWWTHYEDLAMNSLTHTESFHKSLIIRPEWNNENHRSLALKLFNSEHFNQSGNNKYTINPENGWFGATSNLFCHGVIGLEAAMRTYLYHTGFALPCHKNGDDFFWDFGVDDKTPVWRWQIIREAYLAAWLWAWVQLLYGDWSPLRSGVAHTRQALKIMAQMYGWLWKSRETNPDIKRLGIVRRFEWNRIIASQIAYEGNVISHNNKIIYGYGFSGKRTFEVKYPSFNVLSVDVDAESNYLGLPFFLKMAKANDWVEPHDELLASSIQSEEARSFKLVGNLLLSGQSRFGLLKMGNTFRKWCIDNSYSDLPLPLFSQFGVLDSESWLNPNEGLYLYQLFRNTDHARLVTQKTPLNITSPPTGGNFSEKSVRQLWTNVNISPLAYPIFGPMQLNHTLDVLTFPNQLAPETAWPIHWLERLMYYIPRGYCPFSENPLNQIPHSSWQDNAQEIFHWRERVWGPFFSDGRLPSQVEPIEIDHFPDKIVDQCVPEFQSFIVNWYDLIQETQSH